MLMIKPVKGSSIYKYRTYRKLYTTKKISRESKTENIAVNKTSENFEFFFICLLSPLL